MNNISKGYEDINVSVVDYNTSIAEHIWNCNKMTWKKLQNIPYDCNNSDIEKMVLDVAMGKALPMAREQAIITFRLNNISRVCLAQITRQFESRFNIESQMPEPVNHNVILPLNIANDVDLSEKAIKLIKQSQELYNELIEKGFPPQDCRYLLMHGQTTSGVYVVNINKFVSSFAMRCENNLSDEINLVYRLCLYEFKRRLIYDYNNDLIDRLTYKFYSIMLENADCMGAKQHVGKNIDKVFGNSFKRYNDANEEVTSITENCDYDYTKSAWYQELKRLPEYLLFDGEKEMIKKW